jgi:hypothetical protein
MPRKPPNRPATPRPLAWIAGPFGPLPNCEDCFALITDPYFVEAFDSVRVKYQDANQFEVLRRTVEDYHNADHTH